MGDLQQGLVKLLAASISPNTEAAYKTATNAFNHFLLEFQLSAAWPVNSQHVVLFVAYCFEKGLAPSTIHTYVAGVNHFHKLAGGSDLKEVFMIKKLLEGCLRLRKKKDTRLPISIKILMNVSAILPSVCYDEFEVKMFRAAFLLAYFGLFRVSEIVASSNLAVNRSISWRDVSMGHENKHLVIILRISKTSQCGAPITLKIPRETNAELCPVQAVQDYLAIRPNFQGPFFCHANGAPTTRGQFSAVLAKSIGRILPGCKTIKSHSFRIGRATQLFGMGLSGDKIKMLGRWRSDAYKSYIRQ